MTQAPPKQQEMTLERLGAGIAKIIAEQEVTAEGLGSVLLRVQALREKIDELVKAMPQPKRWCPPFADRDTDTVICPGGYGLMRSTKGEKEWTHPLPEDLWAEYTSPTGATGIRKWHNVYESHAADAPPAGGEVEWPSQDAGPRGVTAGHMADADGDVEPDDLPF